MRRENATFKTAFVSYEGSKLHNNDYYGSVELDRFACYAVADGLEPGDVESESARLAVQAAIAAFYERPSLSAGVLRKCVKAAHEALRTNAAHISLRASITVVVTDYQAVRFAWAGNTRFYLYRAGRILHESKDHSLSRQMADRGDLQLDRIARHEERDNLSLYAGQPEGMTPQISGKISLQNGDVFALLTRGLWECGDSGDLRAALDSAENDPNLALDGFERLVLDSGMKELDNYTAAVVFVDKVFIDPNKGKKLKKILMITIPVFVLLLALAVVLVVCHNSNEAKRQDMHAAFLSAVEYIGDDNYVRAGSELDDSLRLAGELKDKEFQLKADGWRKLMDAIQNADYLNASGQYVEAQAAYLIALDRSRYTDNAGKAYIERRLTAVGSFLSVRDLIALGDILTSAGSYTNAESKYLDARRLASAVNDAEGRRLALEALQSLYEMQSRDDSRQQDAAIHGERTLREAADMEAAGDLAAAGRDLISARLYYDISRERFSALEDTSSLERLNGKLLSITTSLAQVDAQTAVAATYIAEGDALFDDGKYEDAKVKYILARNIHSRLQNEAALSEVLTKIDICDSRISSIAPAPTPAAQGSGSGFGANESAPDGSAAGGGTS